MREQFEAVIQILAESGYILDHHHSSQKTMHYYPFGDPCHRVILCPGENQGDEHQVITQGYVYLGAWQTDKEMKVTEFLDCQNDHRGLQVVSDQLRKIAISLTDPQHYGYKLIVSNTNPDPSKNQQILYKDDNHRAVVTNKKSEGLLIRFQWQEFIHVWNNRNLLSEDNYFVNPPSTFSLIRTAFFVMASKVLTKLPQPAPQSALLSPAVLAQPDLRPAPLARLPTAKAGR